MRLLLIDDHVLFRESLRRLLISEPEFEQVTDCGTPEEALSILAQGPVDIVLLDFDLDDEPGTRFITAAAAAGFQGKILMITAGMSPSDIAVARKMGISGVFLKHNSPTLLLQAIRAVAEGGCWWENKPLTGAGATAEPTGSITKRSLTNREQKVLRGVFEGLTTKEISSQAGITQSAVKSILQQLFDKLGVRTRSQLVRIAIEQSLENARTH